MTFLPNWRTILWKSWAIKALGVIALLTGALLVPEVRDAMPAAWIKYIVLISALAGILLRLLDQGIDNVDADRGTAALTGGVDIEPSGPAA